MSRWLPRRRRKAATWLTLLVFALTAFAVQAPRSDAGEQWRAPAHSQVLAQTGSTKRPLSLHEHRSLLVSRAAVRVPADHRPRLEARSILATNGAQALPPARMRYRRCTHDCESEPPA